MSRLRISDPRSLANIARQLGPVEGVDELELRPKTPPRGRVRTDAPLEPVMAPARKPEAEPTAEDGGAAGERSAS